MDAATAAAAASPEAPRSRASGSRRSVGWAAQRRVGSGSASTAAATEAGPRATAAAASVTNFQLPDSLGDHEPSYGTGYYYPGGGGVPGGRGRFLPHAVRNLAPVVNRNQATTLQLDALEFSREPLPFQRQYFKSSTILKMVQVPKRHQGIFADAPELSLNSLRKKAIMLHSYRYQWDELSPEMRTLQLMSAALFGHPLRMAQRDRLGVDLDEALRHRKRERELLPHRREPHDLLLIGIQQLPYGDKIGPAHDMSSVAIRGVLHPRSSRPALRIRPHATTSRVSPAVSLPAADVHSRSPPDMHHVAVVPPEAARRGAVRAAAAAPRRTRPGAVPKEAPPSGVSSVALRLPKIGSGRVITLVSAGPSLRSEVPRPSSSNLSTISLNHQSTQDVDGRDYSDNRDDTRDPAEQDGVQADLIASSAEQDQPEEAGDFEQQEEEEPAELLELDQDERPSTSGVFAMRREETPHPLRGADVSQYDIDQDALAKLFAKLDTDADGHLTYPQVRSHVTAGLSAPQEKFVKLVYDISSASTFFGVQEFIQLKCLCDEIRALGPDVLDSYKVMDFSRAKEAIIRSVELFDDEVGRSANSHISIVALEDVVSIISGKEKDAAFVNAFESMASRLKLDSEFSKLGKIAFISLIPTFLSIESFYESLEGPT